MLTRNSKLGSRVMITNFFHDYTYACILSQFQQRARDHPAAIQHHVYVAHKLWRNLWVGVWRCSEEGAMSPKLVDYCGRG